MHCRTGLIVLAALLPAAANATGLKLDYGSLLAPPQNAAPAMQLAMYTPADAAPLPEAPLRLEYEILSHVVRMAETAAQMKDLLEALPGPNLGMGSAIDVPPGPDRHSKRPLHERFRSTIDETLTRIAHLDVLIRDLGQLIAALPVRQQAPRPFVQAAVGNQTAPIRLPASMLEPEAEGTPWSGITLAVAAAACLLLGLGSWRWRRRRQSAAPRRVSPPATPAADPSAAGLVLDFDLGGPPTVEVPRLPPPAPKQVPDLPAIPGPPPAPAVAAEAPPARTVQAPAAAAPVDVDQALELAEIMMGMGLSEGAANTLVERIQADPGRSLPHWLKLLDIYRKSGMKEAFKPRRAN